MCAKDPSNMPLEDHYAGDEVFEKYSNSFNSFWDSFEEKKELLNMLHGDLIIAKPIAYHLNKRFKQWMHSTPPVLEGFSPLECLKTEQGKTKLKTCLFRFP